MATQAIFVLEVPADKREFYFDGRVLTSKKPVPFRGRRITCRYTDWRQKQKARKLLFTYGPFFALVDKDTKEVVRVLDPAKREEWPDEIKNLKFEFKKLTA